jgi:adenylyltransferase/sulfurtransferase
MTDENASSPLGHEELARYGRHLILPEVGPEGQRRLKESSVVLVGAGGLGSPAGLYLAAAGIGKIGLVDFDYVDHSNLQRQILYGTRDIGRPKLEVARDRLRDVNPHVSVEVHDLRLASENALDILGGYDIVLDGTDNFPTRYLVNDASVLLGKPNVYGSVFRFEGQASVFHAEKGPCYRCLFPQPPPPGLVPSCAEGGVLGVLPGVIGTIQATEAIKLILQRGEPLIGRLLLFDALEMRQRELKLHRDLDCPVCGRNPTIRGLIDYEEFCGVPPAGPPRAGPPGGEVTASELRDLLVCEHPPLVVDVRTPVEWEICRIPDSRLIPLSELPSRLDELDRHRDIVLVCKIGLRSADALDFLRRTGFERSRHLKGGLFSWAIEIDPDLPLY